MKIHIFILITSLIFVFIVSITYQPIFAQVNSNEDLAIVSINRYVDKIPTGTVYVYDRNYSLIRLLDSLEDPTPGQFDGDIKYKNNKLIMATSSREIENSKPDSGPLSKIGAVTIFDGFTGDLIKTIWNPEPNTTPGYVGGTFGSAVELVGNNIVIGNAGQDVNGVYSAGTVYIYDNAGNLQMKIDNPNPSDAANFGASLLSFDDKIIIGNPGKIDGDIAYAGAISILDSKTGNIINAIKNPNPTAYARFGYAMDIEKNKLAVSAPFTAIDNKENVGEVYLFDASSGDLLKTIKNPDPDEGDMFGGSVIFAGDKIIVGSVGDGVSGEGSVFIFNAETGKLLTTIHSPQRTPKSEFYSNEFSTDVAVDGDRLAVGDPHGVVGGIRTGIAYVFNLTSGKLLQTIDNPIPKSGDGFGYYLEFVGDMRPTKDISSEIMQQKDEKNVLKVEPPDQSSNAEFDSKNDTNIIVKKIQWANENEADYTIGGIGVIKLDNQDLNVNKDLIDTYDVHAWSDSDKHGIPVNVIETGVDTGVFFADIKLSGTESSPLRLHVSIGDTVTVSVEDEHLDKPLLDTIKISSKYLSPFQQLETGVPIDEILCDEQYKLIIKNNQKPFCIKEKTYERLVQRGYFSALK